MRERDVRHDLVLAIHPYVQGFGWTVFEAALAPVDWGVAYAKKNKHARCLSQIEGLTERYQPSALVLEEFESSPRVRVKRVRRLCRAIIVFAENRSIETVVVSRASIRVCFAAAGASTRYEIAQSVALQIDALRQYLPKQRAQWEAQHPRMALFNAAALAMTYYAFGSGKP